MAAQVALRRQQDQEEYMRAVQLQSENTTMPIPTPSTDMMTTISPSTTPAALSHPWNPQQNTQQVLHQQHITIPPQPLEEQVPLTPPPSG